MVCAPSLQFGSGHRVSTPVQFLSISLPHRKCLLSHQGTPNCSLHNLSWFSSHSLLSLEALKLLLLAETFSSFGFMKVIFFQFVFLLLTDPLTSLSSRFFSMPKCGHLLSLCSFPVSELISGNPAVLMTYLASSPASPYSSWLRLLQTLLLASEGILSQVTND